MREDDYSLVPIHTHKQCEGIEKRIEYMFNTIEHWYDGVTSKNGCKDKRQIDPGKMPKPPKRVARIVGRTMLEECKRLGGRYSFLERPWGI